MALRYEPRGEIMTELLEFIIAVTILWVVLNFCRLIYKRILLIRKINTLKNDAKAEIKYTASPFGSLFRLYDKPEITVKIGSVIYLIRTYNGGGIGKAVHFARADYTVRFSRIRTASYARVKAKSRTVAAKRGFAVGSKVIPIKQMRVDMIEVAEGLRAEEVLIFNPAPGELSYVTEQKNRIKAAFTGDRVYGVRVFTASTFVAYAEREYRRNLRKEKEIIAEHQREYSYFFDG